MDLNSGLGLDARLGGKDAVLRFTPESAAKTGASLLLSAAGMYLLARGKREQSLNTMLAGAALILGAMFLF